MSAETPHEAQHQAAPEAAPHDEHGPPKRLRAVLLLLIDMVGPIIAYYVLRSMGYSQFVSLLLSAVIPGLSTVYQVIRSKHLDALAVFMMGVTVLSALASLVEGNPRFLLAKDGWVTLIVGIWMLATTRANPPIACMFARPLLEGRTGPNGENWDLLWERLPKFRHMWRVSSIIWGVAIILDSGVRFVFAYTLPVDTVPALNGAQWAVLFVLLQVVTNVYYFRAGLYIPTSQMYAPLAKDKTAGAAGTPVP